MKSIKLYEDSEVTFEKFDNGDFRVTFFKDHHWYGDLTFNKEKGVIYDNINY